jgi:hypothetical protein
MRVKEQHGKCPEMKHQEIENEPSTSEWVVAQELSCFDRKLVQTVNHLPNTLYVFIVGVLKIDCSAN